MELIRQGQFDAAVLFTVLSQNPLPAAMLAYLAGVPRILAYCRENPYHLITDWVPDKEPYELIKHQVRRDLDLVASVGAITNNEDLKLLHDAEMESVVQGKLKLNGVNISRPWLILHAGVSEQKRQYPKSHWVEIGRQLAQQGEQVLFTGSASEKELAQELADHVGEGAIAIAGKFSIPEFVELIRQAPALISVNTGTIHIAAATKTPVVVLYAQTNPQHTPWNCPNKVLEFSVPEHLRSKNEVVAYLNSTLYTDQLAVPPPAEVIDAFYKLDKRLVDLISC